MRALTPEVPSPHPLVASLPELFQEDPVVRAWTDAFDEVLAPVFCTLDGLAAYLDPWLTPDDFLPWLVGWVGVALDPSWPLGRRRAAVDRAAELYRWRGTARGVAAAVELATGITPEVLDSGRTAWSATPGAAPPGDAVPSMVVRLRVGAGMQPDVAAARRAVELTAPAHVPVQVEVVTEGPAGKAR